MPFGTPVYVYKFNGQDLPGYGQLERFDLPMKAGHDDVANRNGGILYSNGLAVRPITLNMNIFSRLATGSGLDHLNDLKDQIRDALRICARVKTPAPLMLGDTDRYLTAVFTGFDSAFAAQDGKKGSYGLNFDALPLFYGATELTDTIAADGDLEITFALDTAETYPTFEIDGTVTGAVLTAPDGRTITFDRDTVTGTVTIDCATFDVRDASGNNVSRLITEVDIGFKHESAGTFTVAVTGYAGTGNITMKMRARYER